MEDGDTFKYIRKSRHISQEAVCNDYISRTTLSKFENNKTMITKNTFEYLINAIDVSFDEFNYIKNNFSYSEKENIIFLFHKLTSNAEHDLILNLIDRCVEYLSKHYSIAVSCILKTLYILISDSSVHFEDETTKNYASDIWYELSRIDSWTILDIKIINCCLFYFETETYSLISEQLVQSLEKYKDFTGIDVLKSAIYNNLTFLFVQHDELEKAKKFSELSLNQAVSIKRIDHIIISLIRFGILFDDEGKKNKGINLLKLYDDKLLKEYIIEDMSFVEGKLKKIKKNI